MSLPVLTNLAEIDGQFINVASLRDAVALPIAFARAGEGFTFFTLNLDHIVKRRDEPEFRDAYARATFVSADGAPVAFLARRADRRIQRTTGADLVVPLAVAAARNGIPLGLFGTRHDVLTASAQHLRKVAPGLVIAAMEAPPMGFDPTSRAAEQACQRLTQAGARIILVALGAPKQEFFAAHMQAQFPGLGFVAIGAALDFIAGTQVRAPEIFQRLGLEWFWRLSTNPGRMARRYGLCARVMVDLLLAGAPARPAISKV